MNVFNRVVMVLLIILILIGTLVAVVMPFAVIDFLIRFLETLRVALETTFATAPLLFLVGQIAVGLAAVIICGVLLVLELRRGRPATVQIVTAEGGRANIVLDSVAMRLAYHLDQLADVISVTPRVRAKGNVINVELDVETSPDVEVPMKTQEILHVTREVIEERMGLKLGRAEVHLRHAPYPQEKGAPTVVGSK